MTQTLKTEPIEKATKRSWDEWLKFMDKIGAKDLTHKDIAAHVYAELKGKIESAGWWSQGITVTYEQYIGRRMPGQLSDGTFQTSVSKSTKLGMQELMDKWVEFAEKDKEVLKLIASEVRVSGTKNRINWRAKGTKEPSIIITSEPKKDGSASIIVTLTGLKSLELNSEAKARWVKIFERFLETLVP